MVRLGNLGSEGTHIVVMFIIPVANILFLSFFALFVSGAPVCEGGNLLVSNSSNPSAVQRSTLHVVPLDKHITLNLANDGTGTNVNADIPIDGTMRLLGEFYQKTDLVCHDHFGGGSGSSTYHDRQTQRICATSATLTTFPSHTGFRCYLYLDKAQFAFLDEERTSTIIRTSVGSRSDMGVHGGLEVVDVSGVAVMCVP